MTEPKYLGGRVASALALVGVTKERVQNLVGGPCGCEEREKKLDDLDRWARRTMKKGVHNARHYLETIFSDWSEDDN